MLAKRSDNRLDDVAMGAAAAADVDLGFGVTVAPFLGEAGEHLGPVALAQQRPVVAAPGALGQHVDRRIEPDGDRPLVEQLRACVGR